MKTRKMIVHLVDGTAVHGKPEAVTEEQFQRLQIMLGENLGAVAWQVNLELDNGSWGIFPSHAVLWIEVVEL